MLCKESRHQYHDGTEREDNGYSEVLGGQLLKRPETS
jgi:hypothetical protein